MLIKLWHSCARGEDARVSNGGQVQPGDGDDTAEIECGDTSEGEIDEVQPV